MGRYTTKQGDMWDRIAFNELGSESLTSELIKLNPSHQNVVIFSAGIELSLPEVDESVNYSETKPPWE